jgi:hypothetical protein
MISTQMAWVKPCAGLGVACPVSNIEDRQDVSILNSRDRELFQPPSKLPRLHQIYSEPILYPELLKRREKCDIVRMWWFHLFIQEEIRASD